MNIYIILQYIHTEFHQEPSMMSSLIRLVDDNRSDVPIRWRTEDDYDIIVFRPAARRRPRRADSRDRSTSVLYRIGGTRWTAVQDRNGFIIIIYRLKLILFALNRPNRRRRSDATSAWCNTIILLYAPRSLQFTIRPTWGLRFNLLLLFYHDLEIFGFFVFSEITSVIVVVVVNRGRTRARPCTINYEPRARVLVVFIIPPSRPSVALQVSEGFAEIVALWRPKC